MSTLIIAEKPSVALRIAIALGNGKQKRIANGRVGYYSIERGGESIYVVAAVGHLFTIKQKGTSREYPILDIEWAPSYQISKSSAFTKTYLDVIRSVALKCDKFINACDYDAEGTVIGTNIIKDVVGIDLKSLGDKAKRMKFSTTTIPELINSFSNLTDIDIDNFYAGETRHIIDWLWGINLSRALTSAIRKYGYNGYLSIGRVQGPTLSVLAKRENVILNFKPDSYWKITVLVNNIEFVNNRGEIFEKKIAENAFDETKKNVKRIKMVKIEKNNVDRWPFPPFDLTSLQLEASKIFRIDPSTALAVAQKLYEHAYISYPRTSSQKLPPTLGLPKIIESISKNAEYEEIAKHLIDEKRFRPIQGSKIDDAHPAIFPTGVKPKNISGDERKLYDLIVRRFLSCFAEPAKLVRVNLSSVAGNETYRASASKIIERGWLDIYTFAKVENKDFDIFSSNRIYEGKDLKMNALQTKPPRRFSKATLLAELEHINLGTKATRASIIDTLFKRNYIEGSPIKTTGFGMIVYTALSKNCGMIMNIETTRALEGDMELISKGEKSEEEVVEEGKNMLLEAIKLFDENKEKIAEDMKESFRKVNSLGACPECGGDLLIKRSRMGKQFVACLNYPKCTNTYSLPQNAKIMAAGEVCKKCRSPIIRIIRRSYPPFKMDLNVSCFEYPITIIKKSSEKVKEDRGNKPVKKTVKKTRKVGLKSVKSKTKRAVKKSTTKKRMKKIRKK